MKCTAIPGNVFLTEGKSWPAMTMHEIIGNSVAGKNEKYLAGAMQLKPRMNTDGHGFQREKTRRKSRRGFRVAAMKLGVPSIFAIVMLICGCQTDSIPSGQRVIKVSFRGQNESFRLRVNRQPIEKIRNGEFTNLMTRLHLDYGDIVVWEDQRDEKGKELTHPKGITEWWFKYLEDVRASFYTIDSDGVGDFFKTPIYHWKAAPKRPRPLPDATFYVDGIPCGPGQFGFRAMLDRIESQKSGWVLIVAPRIKNEGSASPWIAGEQLRNWANEAGVSGRFEKIFFGAYGELTDFARLGDDE